MARDINNVGLVHRGTWRTIKVNWLHYPARGWYASITDSPLCGISRTGYSLERPTSASAVLAAWDELTASRV